MPAVGTGRIPPISYVRRYLAKKNPNGGKVTESMWKDMIGAYASLQSKTKANFEGKPLEGVKIPRRMQKGMKLKDMLGI